MIMEGFWFTEEIMKLIKITIAGSASKIYKKWILQNETILSNLFK